MRVVRIVAVLLVLAAPAGAALRPPDSIGQVRELLRSAHRWTRVWRIAYRSHTGSPREALVSLPSWYGPHHDPALPLVISPHGRGVSARANTRFWGALPGIGDFAVVSPEGQGRRLALYSWGAPGQIADLARMPSIVTRALPWLHVDRHRVYAVGGSMGGQESLLLLARVGRRLAGVVSFDAPTNLAARYRAFPQLRFGRGLQALARYEVGGTPAQVPGAYAVRSPLHWVRRIAFSGVPLQIWWSTRDRIVRNQRDESGLLYREIVRLNPRAPAIQVRGAWKHTAEMRPYADLPFALARLGLLKL